MKKVGYVIEINKNQALIVTSDYNYIHIKSKSDMRIGKLVLFNDNDIITPKFNKYRLIKSACIAAILLIALVVSYSISDVNNINTKNKIYAYVSIDSEKTIEITTDKQFNVLSVYKTNKSIAKYSNNGIEEFFSNLNDTIKEEKFANENDSNILL